MPEVRGLREQQRIRGEREQTEDSVRSTRKSQDPKTEAVTYMT